MRPELLEEKRRLKAQLAQYKKGLQVQQQELSTELQSYQEFFTEKYQQSVKVVQWGKTSVLVLGGLYVVYKLVSFIWRKPTEEAPSGPSIVIREPKESPIMREIKQHIASFLLSIAKKELARLLQQWQSRREAPAEK